MSATRIVVVTQLVGMLIFLMAGGKVETLVARMRGKEATTTTTRVSAQTLVGWAFMFLVLIVAADLEPNDGKLTKSFSWLIFVAILFAYGPQAFGNVSALMGNRMAPYQVNNDPNKRGEPRTGEIRPI